MVINTSSLQNSESFNLPGLRIKHILSESHCFRNVVVCPSHNFIFRTLMIRNPYISLTRTGNAGKLNNGFKASIVHLSPVDFQFRRPSDFNISHRACGTSPFVPRVTNRVQTSTTPHSHPIRPERPPSYLFYDSQAQSLRIGQIVATSSSIRRDLRERLVRLRIVSQPRI